MDDSKNSRRAATGAAGSSDFPSKNSRRGIARKTGAPEGDPSGATPSTPSKNSRRVTGAKIAPSEVTPSMTPTDTARYDGIAPSESGRNDREATTTPLQEGGKNSPVPVGGVAPAERTDKPNGRSNSIHSGSPERLAEVENKHDQSGRQQPTPSQSDNSANIAELSAKVEAMKRQQRASALRGAMLIFMPPVVLCIPLVILKSGKLLLLSWWWCFAPLLLWLIPIASILSIFAQCYRLLGRQGRRDEAAADKEAERG